MRPPPLYVNGFPKAGLHLAIRMALPLFEWASDENVWYGTNAWTLERYNLDLAVDKFQSIKPGQMLMGHTGYMPELQQLFDALRIAMLMIYRDLRDVAVSQTYHILDDLDGNLRHIGRADYSNNKDEVLLQVIQGIEKWPGIVERWKTFETWFDCPFVFPVRYEDMIKKPKWCAKRFFEWICSIALGLDGQKIAYIDRDLKNCIIDYMVFEMGQRQLSATYRRGKTAEWKKEFKPEHVKAFKETDKDNVLLKLGYVKQANW